MAIAIRQEIIIIDPNEEVFYEGSGSMGNESLSRKDIKPATKEETAELYGVDVDDLPF